MINSVNMYASCWICTKVKEISEVQVLGSLMADFSIGESALELVD
jgi:hypothetical protein